LRQKEWDYFQGAFSNGEKPVFYQTPGDGIFGEFHADAAGALAEDAG
jgi:hypothetical protein